MIRRERLKKKNHEAVDPTIEAVYREDIRRGKPSPGEGHTCGGPCVIRTIGRRKLA